MNIETTLKLALLNYPYIYENKWEVYHQLFICNGNGYEWVNGELEGYGDDMVSSIELAIKRQFDSWLGDRLLDRPLKFSIENCRDMCISITKWEERIKDFTCNQDKIYSLCDYAKIMNIPEDIKPAWREAVMEMYNWLTKNPDKTSEEDKEYISRIKL